MPIAVLVKLSAQCVDSLSIAGFIRFYPPQEMYIVTDMMGNINGWSRYVHQVLNMDDLKHMKLANINLLMLCPHLIDFIFPK